MAKIEATGKTIEEAKNNAAEILGVDAEDIMYEILENAKSGFLGINSKPYKISAWREGEENEVSSKTDADKTDKEEAVNINGETDNTEKEEKPRDGRSAENKAEEFLQRILPLMGVKANIAVHKSDEGLDITLSGDGMGLIIGRRGETLDAVQYLTSIVVNKGSSDYVKVTVDTENYRAKRTETLEKLADKVAEKVVRNGRSMTLEPMNPFERRVIHARLQNNEYVTTISVGEDPMRRVVVKLK